MTTFSLREQLEAAACHLAARLLEARKSARREPEHHEDIRRIVRSLLGTAHSIRVADCVAKNPKYNADQYRWVIHKMVEAGELVRLGCAGHRVRRFAKNPLKFQRT
ncbi:MAG: hypothetical protein LBL48_03780 [Azoarcus sp.]|jgi:hypothetical protein|nr:hypothetical protein [Azoarcus sp.]